MSDTDPYGYPMGRGVPGRSIQYNRIVPSPDYDTDALRAELVADEGRKTKPYHCTTGHLSVGVGRNLDANGLRQSEIDLMLDNDIAQAEADLDHLDPNWREHPDAVQRAMINLVFNLGAKGWAQFKQTRAALARKDYTAAARGLAASKWAKQVQSSRRDRIIRQVLSAQLKGGLS
jgi:GH24 family phage-related lysozyme (muramidase)